MQIKAYFSHQFEEGLYVSGYCPLLKVGQSMWVPGKTLEGNKCRVLVEYSASNTNNFLSQYDGYLCFNPCVRSAIVTIKQSPKSSDKSL
ncbi:unnamed protein product [marine sediment metagenome]|uniref:Uncharacterized protein n=1 Tax=marine sediment metagenome TaxID=412755 RepID=X1F649_9ZZZZ